MSSNAFFNQSFSPAPSSGNRPPPPPPPRSGGSSVSSGPPRSGNLSSSSRSNMGATSTSTTSNSMSNGNYQSSSNPNKKPMRPTGNYYATTDVSSSAAPAPTFYSATGQSSGTINTHTAANPYETSNPNSTNSDNPYAAAAAPSPSANNDWFSGPSTQNSTTQPTSTTQAAPSPYSYGTDNSSSSSLGGGGQDVPMSTFVPNPNPPNRSESVELMKGVMNSNGPEPTNTPANSGFMGSMNPFGGGASNNVPSNMSNTNNEPNSTIQPIEDYDNEPPLLEELGINLTHIKTKSLSVILPMKYAKSHIDSSIMEDTDLAGPLAFALLLGGELLLAAKIHFGYIYGLGLFGCFGTSLVLNLMSPSDSISVWTVVSILGYSLIPVNVLAGVNVVYRIRYMGKLGVVLAAVTIGWCTFSSTRLFERGCGLREQRFLVGYPVTLLYSAFVMMTIF